MSRVILGCRRLLDLEESLEKGEEVVLEVEASAGADLGTPLAPPAAEEERRPAAEAEEERVAREAAEAEAEVQRRAEEQQRRLAADAEREIREAAGAEAQAAEAEAEALRLQAEEQRLHPAQGVTPATDGGPTEEVVIDATLASSHTAPGLAKGASVTESDCQGFPELPSAITEELLARPGLGDEDCPGFPAEECPEELPDLSSHFSIAAKTLWQDPALYARLRALRTPGGVSLARCIKTGMDNRGHRLIRTLGLVAGDADCYGVFGELFDRVIAEWHPHWQAGAAHPTDLDAEGLSAAALDLARVTSVAVRLSRNLRGLAFPPAASLEERREAEVALRAALAALPEELGGEYMPLRGSSSSCPLRPGGMSIEEEAQLKAKGLLMQAPDAGVVLSSGEGRHWPHGRGVFVAKGGGLVAHVNGADHLRLEAAQEDV